MSKHYLSKRTRRLAAANNLIKWKEDFALQC